MTSQQHQQVIEEFRTHEGKVSGRFEGAPLLLLTTTGARSGQRHTTPLRYLLDETRLIVFAANGGASTNPAWYYNLLAHPDVTIEVGGEAFEGHATLVSGQEQISLLNKQMQIYPHFASYMKTTRQIPVVALERRSSNPA